MNPLRLLKVKKKLTFICLQDLINQGRQKVIEATTSLKTLARESPEDTIARLVSV